MGQQTQRIVGGAISGATIGGIIGHQHAAKKEGIIIGSVLGMFIGNKSGQGADHRAEQRRWEENNVNLPIKENFKDESNNANIVINKHRLVLRLNMVVRHLRMKLHKHDIVQNNEKQNCIVNLKFVEFKKNVAEHCLSSKNVNVDTRAIAKN